MRHATQEYLQRNKITLRVDDVRTYAVHTTRLATSLLSIRPLPGRIRRIQGQ